MSNDPGREVDPPNAAEPAEPAEPADPAEPAEPAEAGAVDTRLADRRAFIRQLSGEAVVSAGRIAGLSSVFRRTVLAAGAAVGRELEVPEGAQAIGGEPGETTGTPAAEATVAPVPAPAPAAAPSVAPTTGGDEAPPPAIDVAAALTPEQQTILASGLRVLLAVNDRTGAPHLSASAYHWDGAILRLPARMFAARAEHVDRDPRVSAYIEDPASGAWVVVTGVASIVYGQAADDDLALILAAHGADDAAAARWADVRSRGEAIVIRIRPIRFLWRPG